MADQGSGSPMVEIAAARALQWNVEFDRGLRSPKPGAQCEAVMKLGPQLVRWSHSSAVTASSANLFKLEPGQDRVFANAILLRLADTFRSGNNFIRACILKVLMLEFKGRGWIGEVFTADNFEKVPVAKRPIAGASHSRSVRSNRWRGEGLLTKNRIANHVEMLRRVKSVIDSGDPTSRALALRVLGCLADLGKDSVDVHNLVLQAVHSPHHQEVSAAFFAMGCLSELSDEFGGHALQKAYEMVNAMETPPQVRVFAVRLFAKLGHSPILSLQAYEMGRKLMLRYPIHELVTAILISLTILAAESSVIMRGQVDLLLTYLSSDPRMNVRAVALKCLGKLIPQALYCIDDSNDIFSQVFSVVKDAGLPSTLHVFALWVIQKLFHQRVTTMEFEHLLQIMSWVELTALNGIWAVVSEALSLLVDMVSDVMKFRMKGESPENRTELINFSTRVCLLLCDQVSITGGCAVRSGDVKQAGVRSGSLFVEEEEIMTLTKVKASTLSVLLVKLVQVSPPVGWSVVDSVAGIIEALARRNIGKRKEFVAKEGLGMNTGHECEAMEIGQPSKESAGVKSESLVERDVYNQLDAILKELGHCLATCVHFVDYKGRVISRVHRRLHQLISFLTTFDIPSLSFTPVLIALMKANIAHDTLTRMADTPTKSGAELELDVRDTRSEGELKFIAESRATLQLLGIKLFQGGCFRMAYSVGKQAALCGFWELAQSTFASLVGKVSSEGCYFWLKGLSCQAEAEFVLQIGNDGSKDFAEEGNEQCASTLLPRGSKADRRRATISGGDDGDTLQGTRIQQVANMEESILGRFGKAAACAMPLLRSSISSLSAGICLERMFEFQRWVLTLRLEEVECVSELVGLLASIASFDADAGVIDLEDEDKNDMKGLGSALRASIEKVEVLASRLKKLSEEYDLLSISFLSIDQRSIRMLSRAAILSSMLAFCSVGALSSHPTPNLLSAATLNVGALALDLYHRLQQIEGEDWNDLLSFAIQSGDCMMSARGFGGALETGPQEIALANLSRWAVMSILALQKQHSLVSVVRGARLLQQILVGFLHIPWLSPAFFFCTRQRTGVELFVAQAGPSAGETDELLVMQGSALALSVCLQIVNAPFETLTSLKRLVCALSIQLTDSSSKPNDGGHVCPKAGSVVNQPLNLALIEKLILHSKMPVASRMVHVESNADSRSSAYSKMELAPDLFFSVCVDAKGQGFASCTLDVRKVPCGEYQLSLSCICLDKKSEPWVLPPLNTRPVLRIA